MSYFLIAVSNKENLELCIKYALAGFTNSINGAWTFVEINKGDYVSFLYGARAHNLYKVERKLAYKNAAKLPPWPSVTFSMSGKIYYFPFRLFLKPVREFVEPLVRAEFSYVAENLLLRGGYRRTHFQADQTTLQAVSQMGDLYKSETSILPHDSFQTFDLGFTKNKSLMKVPQVFQFRELILQSLIRQYLSADNHLRDVLEQLDLSLRSEKLEVLGEKALPEGHIDLLIKEAVPIEVSRKIIIEVKTGAGTTQDVEQIMKYVSEMGDECLGGVLIASKFSDKVVGFARNNSVALLKYGFGPVDLETAVSFRNLLENLSLHSLE